MPKEAKSKMSIIESVGLVAEKLKDSKLKVKKTKAFSETVEKLNEYFGTTDRQTWLLCAMLSLYFENKKQACRFRILANFFDCSVLTTLSWMGDIETIISKYYMYNVLDPSGSNGYKIDSDSIFQFSEDFLNCVLQNEKPIMDPPELPERSVLDMIRKIRRLVRRHHSSKAKNLIMQTEEKKYANEPFVIETNKLLPGSEFFVARMMFYICCSYYITGDIVDLEELLDDTLLFYGSRFAITREFMDESFILFKRDLILFDQKGNVTDATIEITQKAKEMLLGENVDLFTKMGEGSGVIKPEAIIEKEMFYEEKNLAELSRLTSSLQEENLCEIQKRLAQKGLPKGIAVLFYGDAGTGKTETVYQLAKKTGRIILHVDISRAKSCWFGESEKKVKQIFTDYRQLCRACNKEKGKMPILFFNEADAIFSKRKDSNASNVAQTENTIQNIILEEVEKLDGILIATTNLASNLDVAFERRFLFKIKFENPSVAVKRKIWKSKITFLSEGELTAFAEDYDFTGGQIDNIVRKLTMDEIISGIQPTAKTLSELCKHEKIDNDSTQQIGFFS